MIAIKFFTDIPTDENFKSYSHKEGIKLLQHSVKKQYNATVSNIDIAVAKNGKPYFISKPYKFNISHCKAFAVCAVSDREIGIDCESIRKCSDRVVKRCFSSGEADYLLTSKNPDFDFTLLWTLKESYGKYLGTGVKGICNTSFDIINGIATFDSKCDFKVKVINDKYIISCCMAGNNKISVKMEYFDIDFCDILEYNI